ncbi:3'-5' exoribonuclease domain-containing protein [Trabulsiella odontotermitis]|uniref:3'-5' exoribonuclease domain-containing protein n=1 Tax=Trabulsiella odontotermitis TaxID=379893 RepID=UPI000675F971|nr:3'-5' exoribonuclease [Trabulsiella odontotermitis]KNC89841.1 hypothetical protein GM30_05595 [Trabulsiella odontotermitis]
MNNFMLDIRALGKSLDSTILAIECVFFDPSTGEIGPQGYWPVSINQSSDNLKFDEGVIPNLLRADSDTRAEIINATLAEKVAVFKAIGFICTNSQRALGELNCWVSGDSSSIARLGLKAIHHSINFDEIFSLVEICHLSTLILIAGATGYAPHPRRDSAPFTLTDAVYRAEQVCDIWQRLTSNHADQSFDA